MAPDDENDDQPVAGVFTGSLSELLQSQQREHDRRMALDVVMMEVYDFLDGLNVAQLLTLRRILNIGDGAECANNNYIDGQIITLLRRVHNVNPINGESLELRVPEA